MFIFREKSGLQLVMETIGKGNPQKAGQRVKPGDPQLPCAPAAAGSPRHHGILGGPLPFSHQRISQWPSCLPNEWSRPPFCVPPPKDPCPHLQDGSSGFPVNFPHGHSRHVWCGAGVSGPPTHPQPLPPDSSRHSAPGALRPWGLRL